MWTVHPTTLPDTDLRRRLCDLRQSLIAQLAECSKLEPGLLSLLANVQTTISAKESLGQEDRLTYKPGDLELVNIGDGPPMSRVEEERRKKCSPDANSLHAALHGELIYKPDIATHYSAAFNSCMERLYGGLAAIGGLPPELAIDADDQRPPLC